MPTGLFQYWPNGLVVRYLLWVAWWHKFARDPGFEPQLGPFFIPTFDPAFLLHWKGT